MHETLREAIARHVEKDLGPMALPRIPTSPVPFTVAEYFPTPGQSLFTDPRQHAISLAYLVPVDGEAAPQEDALELNWYDVSELLESGPAPMLIWPRRAKIDSDPRGRSSVGRAQASQA